MVKKLKSGMEVEHKDDAQSWWDKYESIITDANELGLKTNFETFLWRWMVLAGKEGKLLSENEDKIFKKALKNVDDKDVFARFQIIYNFIIQLKFEFIKVCHSINIFNQ